jgi:hypothetical protein
MTNDRNPPPKGWGIVQFDGIRQISQQMGTDDEHMLAVLLFSYIDPDKDVISPGMSLTIKQLVGSKTAPNTPIELVGRPSHKIPVALETLRQIAERYYKTALPMVENSAPLVMTHNEFRFMKQYDVKLLDDAEAGW